jgi:CHASE1-domain containing sensor protein
MTEQHKPSLALPIVIAISGILSSFLGWGFVLKERRDDSTRSIQRAASSARRAVGMEVEAQVNSLRGLASLWDRFGAGPDPQWRFGTRQVMQHARGVEWIAWLDRDGIEDRFVSAIPASQLEPTVKTRAFSLASDKVVDGPIAAKEGDALRYWVVLPIGEPSGDVLVASVSAEDHPHGGKRSRRFHSPSARPGS